MMSETKKPHLHRPRCFSSSEVLTADETDREKRERERRGETNDNEEKVNDMPVRVDNAYYFVDNVSKNYFLRTRVLFSSG